MDLPRKSARTSMLLAVAAIYHIAVCGVLFTVAVVMVLSLLSGKARVGSLASLDGADWVVSIFGLILVPWSLLLLWFAKTIRSQSHKAAGRVVVQLSLLRELFFISIPVLGFFRLRRRMNEFSASPQHTD